MALRNFFIFFFFQRQQGGTSQEILLETAMTSEFGLLLNNTRASFHKFPIDIDEKGFLN